MATTQSSTSKKRHDNERFIDAGAESNIIPVHVPPTVEPKSDEVSSLYEVVQPILHLVDDLLEQVERSLEKCKNPEDGLTNDESAAIYLYTLQCPKGKNSFYTVFNRALRAENRINSVQFQQYFNLFMAACHKLPSIQDYIWRGETGNWGSKYQPGTIHVWSGVSSCSETAEIAREFQHKTEKSILFQIESINGKSIKNHSEYPDENEVILPPGAYVIVNSLHNAIPNEFIADLQEITPIPEEISQMAATADFSSNTTEIPQVDDIIVIWLDPNVNKFEGNKKNQDRLRQIFYTNFQSFEKSEEAVKYIQDNQSKHFLLITGGQIGRQIVPELNNYSRLQCIIIYCMNKQGNEEWAKNYEKVKAVVVKADEMIERVQELYQNLRENEDLSPISGFENQPLVSLEESLQPLVHIIPKLEQSVLIARMNCRCPLDGLMPDESAAIHIYTMEWGEFSLYRPLNEDLRSRSRVALKKWLPYLKLLLIALNKLPSYEGTVCRGLNIDISGQYRVGQKGIWWGFSGTSRNMPVLQRFIGQDGLRTLFSIQCNSGKSISQHSYIRDEDEIMLLSGFSFEVTSNFNAGNGLHVIGLKEIAPISEEAALLAAWIYYSHFRTGMPPANNILVIWLDPNVNKFEGNKKNQDRLRRIFHTSFQSFEKSEEAVKYMQDNQNKHFLLIIGEQIGRQIVPELNNFSQLQCIIIYCMNKQGNEEWTKNYEKVKAVVVKADEMIAKVLQLHRNLQEKQGLLPSKNSECNHLKHSDINNDVYTPLSPFSGLEKEPILSLAESLQPIAHIIPELKKCIGAAMMKCENPVDGLTQNESAAIYIYTMYWTPYEECLSYMLNKDLRSESGVALKKWFRYLKLLLHALNKLPSYKGTVWRGLQGDMSDRYEVGQECTWWGFSSTTRNMSVLESSEYMGRKGPRTLFVIECKNGKSISRHSHFPDEDDVLLFPGFGCEVTGKSNTGELHIINLKETDSSFKLVQNYIQHEVRENMATTQQESRKSAFSIGTWLQNSLLYFLSFQRRNQNKFGD